MQAIELRMNRCFLYSALVCCALGVVFEATALTQPSLEWELSEYSALTNGIRIVDVPANSCHGLKLMLHFQSSVSVADGWSDSAFASDTKRRLGLGIIIR